MKIERLRLFAELVNQGSYTKAAEYLDVSKAYLSKQIRLLEQDLQNQLLIRNTRTMRLTSAGQSLYEHANKLTTFWQDSQQLISAQDDSLSGTVRFTAPTGLLKYLMMEAIEDFCRVHPNIGITAETGNQTYNLVSTPYDFAIRITNTPPEDVIAKKLGQFSYVCCATPEYLAKNGVPGDPRGLLEHTCISLSYWKNWLFKSSTESFEVDTQAKFQFSDNEILKQAALKSLGICRLPSYLIGEELRSGALVPLFGDIESDSKGIYLLYPQSIRRPNRVNLLVQAIEQQIKGLL